MPDSLAEGIVEIDCFLQCCPFYAGPQLGIVAAGLVHLETQRLHRLLGENVDAAVLFGEVLGTDPVGGQLSGQFLSQRLGFGQRIAAPKDALLPFVINDLKRRVSFGRGIPVAVVGLRIGSFQRRGLLAGPDSHRRLVNGDRNRTGGNLGDWFPPRVALIRAAHIPF